jgi:hypothetical protein
VGGSHQEDEIRQGYTTQGWPIAEPFVNSVKVQVDRVKQFVEKNKLFVFEDMTGTLEQLFTCMWKLDEFGKPTNEIKDEKKYHLLACLRYLCTLFTTETIIKPQPTTIQDLRPSHLKGPFREGIQNFRRR